MIIYQESKSGFLHDVAQNHLQARLEAAFLRKTGSIPSDRMGWASDYARFSSVLGQAAVADDIQVAIEHHCSPFGRFPVGGGTVKRHPCLQARQYAEIN